MNDLPVGRRLLLAVLGISVSALLLRAQLADALVIRGDGWLYRAQASRALAYYRRALLIDRNDGIAVDRFAFVAMMLREAGPMRDGIHIASAYLKLHPSDSVIRMDRAMAYRVLGNSAGALEDFAEVGWRTHDARALTLAGYAAQAVGERARARFLLRGALALDPKMPAALHALRRSGATK